MTTPTRSGVFAFKEETTEGTLIAPVAADFVPGRDGFSFTGELETIDSDELVNDIGASKSYAAKEIPKGSFPMYLRHSGTEGTAPQYDIIIKSAMGTQTDNATEYSTNGTSTAGTSAARASLEMGSGQEDNFVEGQAVLIKDGANGYAIRNVNDVDSAGDQLNLNFNLSAAPATATALGKANHFSPAAQDHPTFSAYHYGASSGSDFKQAIAGCRTTSLNFDFPANGFAEMSAEFEGIEHFMNYIEIDATNNKINFIDNVSELTATLASKVYKSPLALADEIASKMTTASAGSQADTITCTYSSSTGKFTITSDGSTFELHWKTGTNGADGTDTHAGTILGYSDAADDTGALTYAADNVQAYDPPATPSYDTADNIVLKNCELLIGNFDDITSRKTITASCTIATPKTDVPDLTAESGIDSSLIGSRKVTFQATILLEEHEAALFDAYVNNTTRQLMFNAGPKDGAGNWEVGKCFNLYMANAALTGVINNDNDGYRVYEITAEGFVDSDKKDVHINYI